MQELKRDIFVSEKKWQEEGLIHSCKMGRDFLPGKRRGDYKSAGKICRCCKYKA